MSTGDWAARLLGGGRVPSRDSVLGSYGQALRLVRAMGLGPLRDWLQGRLTLRASAAQMEVITASSLAVQARRWLAANSYEDRVLMAQHIADEVFPGLPAATSGVDDAMHRCDPASDPALAVSGMTLEVESMVQLFDAAGLLEEPPVGPQYPEVHRGPTMATLWDVLSGGPPSLRSLRWNTQQDRLHGRMATSGVPLWCSDLVLPDPQVQQISIGSGVGSLIPMAVLYGDHQVRPPVLSATAQVSFERLSKLVQDAVIRYMPSGACTVELTGLPEDACEVALPTSPSMVVTPPSSVANIVVYGPGSCAPEGVLARYKVDNGAVVFNPILDRSEPWRYIRGVAAQPDPQSLFSYQRKQSAGEDITQYQVATCYGDPRDYGIFSMAGPLSLAGSLYEAGYDEETIRQVMRASDLPRSEGRAVIDLHARTGLLIYDQVDFSWESTPFQKKTKADFACQVSEADFVDSNDVSGPASSRAKPPVKKTPGRGATESEQLRHLKSQDAIDPKDTKILQHPVLQKSKAAVLNLNKQKQKKGPPISAFSAARTGKPPSTQKTDEVEEIEVEDTFTWVKKPSTSGDNSADWACPNDQCANSVRLVFGTKSRCPMCSRGKNGSWLPKQSLEPSSLPSQSSHRRPGQFW